MPKTITIDPAKLIACVAACRAAGVSYGLGAKAPSLSAVPGKDFRQIDCSGFCRLVLYQASGGAFTLTDGSVQQHESIESEGFASCPVSDGKLTDGRVRIAFLTPADGGGVGHVALVLNALTVESHGGVGPDRRSWIPAGWQLKTGMFVLTGPIAPEPKPSVALTLGGAVHHVPALVVNEHIMVSATDLASALELPLHYDAQKKQAVIG